MHSLDVFLFVLKPTTIWHLFTGGCNFYFISDRSLLLRKIIKDSDNHLLYCVPYHPETNPIEEFFSQLKHYIRKSSPQDYKEISDKIKEIMKTKIKKTHLENYFKHSFHIYK